MNSVTRYLTLTILLAHVSFVSCSPRSDSSPTATSSPNQSPQTPQEELSVFRLETGSAPVESTTPQSDKFKVVEGSIKGILVQKKKVLDGPSKDNPMKKMYSAYYFLTRGNQIAAINEEGVHPTNSDSEMLAVNQENKPLDDNDVVETGLRIPEGRSLNHRTSGGGVIMRTVTPSFSGPVANTVPLIGEFRTDPKSKKGRVFPNIEIYTKNGVVSIPIEKLARFKTNDN